MSAEIKAYPTKLACEIVAVDTVLLTTGVRVTIEATAIVNTTVYLYIAGGSGLPIVFDAQEELWI